MKLLELMSILCKKNKVINKIKWSCRLWGCWNIFNSSCLRVRLYWSVETLRFMGTFNTV